MLLRPPQHDLGTNINIIKSEIISSTSHFIFAPKSWPCSSPGVLAASSSFCILWPEHDGFRSKPGSLRNRLSQLRLLVPVTWDLDHVQGSYAVSFARCAPPVAPVGPVAPLRHWHASSRYAAIQYVRLAVRHLLLRCVPKLSPTVSPTRRDFGLNPPASSSYKLLGASRSARGSH